MPETLAGRLLEWFRTARRDLPWRTPFPRDPYAVLVSEVMLQQTQVERVKDAFIGFMRRFPTVAALAAACEADAVHAFSGLGYYRRARLLHAAARAVVVRGSFPRNAAELAALPGLGPYTAAAVAAFAFAGSDPPADGNIARVTARLQALDLAAARGFAASLGRGGNAPEVWEALMELGATVCTPATPACPSCPLGVACRALGRGVPQAYPRPRSRRSRERTGWATVWLEREDGRVLLRRIEGGAVLAGVWLPPYVTLAAGASPAAAARSLAAEAGFSGDLATAPTIRHTITHRDIVVHAFVARLPRPGVAENREGWSWQRPASPEVPTSSLLAKLAAACRGVLPHPGETLEG